MLRMLLLWLINAASLLLVAELVPGIVIEGLIRAMLAALVLGLVNVMLRPLMQLLALPITLLTFGLFALVINGLCFWLVANMLEGFSVSGFWAAFWGALTISVVSWAFSTLLSGERR